MQGSSLWAQVFSAKFLKGKHILRCKTRGNSKCFKALKPFFEQVVLQSGRGDQTNFWCDQWLGDGPLIWRLVAMPQYFPKVNEVFVDSQW